MKRSIAGYLDVNIAKDFLTAKNTLSIPTGNLGISRNSMPQITNFDKFKSLLLAYDIDIKNVRERIGSIKLAQNEVNKDKVFKMMMDYRYKNKRSRGSVNFEGFPPVITSDGFVLDGLHRQVAMYNVNKHAYHDYAQVNATFKTIYSIIRSNPGEFFGAVEYKRL